VSHSNLNENHSSFRQIFNSSPDPAWIIEGYQFIECNDAAVRILGYQNRDELLNVHPSKLSPLKQSDGEDSFTKAERMMSIANELGLHRFEWIHTRANGEDFIAEVTLSRIDFTDRRVIYCVWRDITERKQAEIDMQNSEKLFRMIADSSPLAIYMSSGLKQTKDYINPTFVRLFGYTEEQLPSATEWWPLAYPDASYRKQVADEWQHKVAQAIETHSEIEPMETIVTCKDGSEKHISWGLVSTGHKNWTFGADLTENKRREDELREIAFHDSLTRLPNRRLLLDRLQQALHNSKRQNSHAAVLFLDLNKFKPLNDTYGHNVGDQLLIEVANRLLKEVRSSDTVVRLGGDEFVVLLQGLDAAVEKANEQASLIVNKIRAVLGEEYSLGGVVHHSSASIGMKLFIGDECDPDQIIKEADAAMYEDKKTRSIVH
jgi:diguanylate cyclase (GGDEF)-like protein/PAS domain S-box-containing protein